MKTNAVDQSNVSRENVDISVSGNGMAGMAELKEQGARITEIKQKLREMEDLELITKLETIQTQDEIIVMQDDFSVLSKKVDLISDALKILSAKMDNVSKSGAVGVPRQAKSMDADLASLKNDIEDIRMKAGNAGEYVGKIRALEDKYNDIDGRLRSFMESVSSQLEARKDIAESNTSAVSAASAAASPAGNSGVSDERAVKLERDVESLKSLVAGLDTAFRESKESLRDIREKAEVKAADSGSDSSVYDALKNDISSLGEKIASVEERIANLAKRDDVERIEGEIKAAQSQMAPTAKADVSNIHAVPDMSADVASVKKDVEQISESFKDIEARISDRIGSIETEMEKLKSSRDSDFVEMGKALRKLESFDGENGKIQSELKQVNDTAAVIGDKIRLLDSNMSKETKRLDAEIAAIKTDFSKLGETVSGDDAGDYSLLEGRVGSLECRLSDDVGFLKGQLSGIVNAQGFTDDAVMDIGRKLESSGAQKANMKEIAQARKDAYSALKKADGFDSKFKEYRQKFSGDVLSLKKRIDLFDSKAGQIDGMVNHSLTTLKADVDKVRKENGALNDHVKALGVELKHENESLAGEIKKLKDHIDKPIKVKPKVVVADATLEERIKAIEDGVADYNALKVKLLDYLKKQMSDGSKDSLKYVPVIKENVAKLYKAYTGAEKRITNVERMVSGIDLSIIETSVDALNKHVMKEMDLHKKEHDAFADRLRKDHDAQLLSLKMEVAEILESTKKNGLTLEQFDDFKADVLGHVDVLKEDIKGIEARGVSLSDKVKKDCNSQLLSFKAEMADMFECLQKSDDLERKDIEDFKSKVLSDIDGLQGRIDKLNILKSEDVEKIVAKGVDSVKSDVDNRMKSVADMNRQIEEKLKAQVDAALKGQADAQKQFEGDLKKDYDSRFGSLSESVMNMSKLLELKRKSNDLNYEEFAEFREKVLEDIDRLNVGVDELGGALAGEAVEKALDQGLDRRNKVIYDRLNELDGKVSRVDFASMEKDMEFRVKRAVDKELKDVILNINTIGEDIKGDAKKHDKDHAASLDRIRKDYRSELLALKAEFAQVLASKRHSSDMNYEEFAEFRAKVLSDIDGLRDGLNSVGKVLNHEDVENIVDNKVMGHVQNIDMLANSVKMLDRKMEQKHLEVAKSSHQKITDSVKSVDDRISAIEGDIELLKDMKADLVNDVNEVVDHMKGGADGSKFVTETVVKGYELKIAALEKKIREMEAKSVADDELVEKTLGAKLKEFEMKISQLEEKNKLGEMLKSQLATVQNRNESLSMEIENSLHTKFSEFENKLQNLESGVASRDYLEKRISVLQNESDILRSELDKMRALYFEMAEREEEAPVVIE